jgi:hypothetical protein
MEERTPDRTHEGGSDPQEQPNPARRREPTQHDLMRKDLPKQDVAVALEDFDGDEN